jgi:hypothetical protein
MMKGDPDMLDRGDTRSTVSRMLLISTGAQDRAAELRTVTAITNATGMTSVL